MPPPRVAAPGQARGVPPTDSSRPPGGSSGHRVATEQQTVAQMMAEKSALERALARLKNRQLAKAFDTWHAEYELAFELHNLQLRALFCWTHREFSAAFNTWYEAMVFGWLTPRASINVVSHSSVEEEDERKMEIDCSGMGKNHNDPKFSVLKHESVIKGLKKQRTNNAVFSQSRSQRSSLR